MKDNFFWRDKLRYVGSEEMWRDGLRLCRRNIAISSSIATYSVCLAFAPYRYCDAECVSNSLEVVLVGAVSGNSAWLANPMLFAGWIALGLRWNKVAFASSVACLCLAVHFWCHPILYGDFRHEFLFDPRGFRVATGFWLWVASMLWVVNGSTVNILRSIGPAQRPLYKAAFTFIPPLLLAGFLIGWVCVEAAADQSWQAYCEPFVGMPCGSHAHNPGGHSVR